MRSTIRSSTVDRISAAVSGVLDDAAGGISLAEREMLAFVDGVLTAAVVGPERTYPDEWMHAVFQDRPFEDVAMMQASATLLLLLHNQILRNLRLMGKNYGPRFLDYAEDGEQIGLAEHWAQGFVTGVGLRGDAWEAMVSSKEARPILAPIVMFLTREDGTSPLAVGHSPEELAKLRGEALALLGPAIHALFRYWNAHARHSRSPPIGLHRKVGRNEPCPCGSGRKHKKCCLMRAA